MKSKIYPAIWCNNNASDIFNFYTETFYGSQIIESNPIVVSAEILQVPFIGINGGPIFRPNNAISFMIICETEEEIKKLWQTFEPQAEILMSLQSYPWSPHYGWLCDLHGVSWQFYLGKLEDVNNQQLVPTLMFCGPQQGRCQEAIHFYAQTFKHFKSQGHIPYPDGEKKRQIMHAQFIVEGFTLMAMDSGVDQSFSFNEGVSFVISCDDQDEIDYYWDLFTAKGEESRCGWCKDQFGVSWQIVPKNLSSILQRYPDANKALMQMAKIEIENLKK
ncbi:VOC family protein [Sphingobacterium sp. LRF_L2]|uniref:VOC family protein n=1 Tax=Sphingobacterium sp. LRF_L2 TaxID=3369421 RepID=UPI003F633734